MRQTAAEVASPEARAAVRTRRLTETISVSNVCARDDSMSKLYSGAMHPSTGRPWYKGRMSDITIHEGDEYTAIFHGGPFDGTTDTRTATSDAVDDEVTVYADVEGLQTAFTYKATKTRQVLDQTSVEYEYDAADSDPVDDLQDRGDRSGEFDRE